MEKKVCVLGLGYIGLPTAAMFASNGIEVVGVDVNKNIVDTLKNRMVHIEEPYLHQLVTSALDSKLLRVQSKPEICDVYIIAVPTPIDSEKRADLTYVVEAIESIKKLIKAGDVVILESTSPVGTTENIIAEILIAENCNLKKDVFLGYSPERVLPGKILFELVNNSRIIGGYTAEAAEKIKEIYKTFVKGEIFTTDSRTAELCKLMENTYRDVNIALANELARVCEVVGSDVWDVIKMCNQHPRVNIHHPGIGVGGHCLAVDPWFVIESAKNETQLISMARKINDSTPCIIAKEIDNILSVKNGKNILCLGLTYKADVDDIRESPAIELVNQLKLLKYNVKCFDPFVSELSEVNDIYDNHNAFDLVVLAVNHSKFRKIDLERLFDSMENKIIYDGGNFFDRLEVEMIGFEYHVLGAGN